MSKSSYGFWPRPEGFDFGPDSAFQAIDRAERYGDYKLLADHLRKKSATEEEILVIADILEGNIPPKGRGKPGSHKSVVRHVEIYQFVEDLIDYEGWSTEAAVAAAQKKFKPITREHIYKIRRSIKKGLKSAE